MRIPLWVSLGERISTDVTLVCLRFTPTDAAHQALEAAVLQRPQALWVLGLPNLLWEICLLVAAARPPDAPLPPVPAPLGGEGDERVYLTRPAALAVGYAMHMYYYDNPAYMVEFATLNRRAEVDAALASLHRGLAPLVAAAYKQFVEASP